MAAIEADPQAVAAYAFYGDALLMGAKDPAAALVQYEKAIALDPTLPMMHFFASTALRLLGRPAEAREELVKALALYPSYEAAWKVINASQASLGLEPAVRHRFEPPPGLVGKTSGKEVEVFLGKDGEWLGYAVCKAVWANEARFRKLHAKDGWSIEEERACVINQIMGHYNQAEARLAEAKNAEASDAEIKAALPPLERHLFDVAEAKLLDGFLLFEVIGRACPLTMSLLDDHALGQVEAYVRKYVLVPAN